MAARFSGEGQPYAGLARRRSNGLPQWTGIVRYIPEHLHDPLGWSEGRRIFVNSMSDLFHETLDAQVIVRIYAVMALAPWHIYQTLTKRAARQREILSAEHGETFRLAVVDEAGDICADAAKHHHGTEWARRLFGFSTRKEVGQLDEAGAYEIGRQRVLCQPWPLRQVHVGVSAGRQETWDEKVPELLRTRAAVRWVSAEPLIGAIDMTREFLGRATPCADCPKDADCGCGYELRRNLIGEPAIDWVVGGGESGPDDRRREMDVAWIASLAEQCAAAGIAFYAKQDSGIKPGKRGRIPDHAWRHEYPAIAANP